MIFFCKAHNSIFLKILPINVAAHSYLMKPATTYLYKYIKQFKFKKPKFLLVNNSTLRFETVPNVIKKSLIQQLYKCVYWKKIIDYMMLNNISIFLELGVIPNLAKMHRHELNSTSYSLNRIENFFKVLKKIT